MSKPTKSRNPAGLATKKPIALRLTPRDRAEAERLAAEENVSLSLLAYRAYRAGLHTVTGDKPTQKRRTKRTGSRAGMSK